MTNEHDGKTSLSEAATFTDTVESVKWKPVSASPEQEVVITGTVVLLTALKLAYKYFTTPKDKTTKIIITRTYENGTHIDIRYSGPKDVAYIES
jgi:hypothetical protein